MKANNVPIIVHPASSLQMQELKEQKQINAIAKRQMKIESVKDAIVYLTRTEIYFVRYKKRSKKQK